jgi:hypothetical protein
MNQAGLRILSFSEQIYHKRLGLATIHESEGKKYTHIGKY